MSDLALENAQAHLAALEEQISKKDEDLQVLRRDLTIVRAFISAWYSFAQNSVPSDTEEHSVLIQRSRTVPPGRPKNLPKEEIGDIAAQIIEARGQPVPRNAIFAALENEGITLRGTDPKLVLSTMLWRLKPRFIRLKGYGYWLADRDYEPAGYKAPKSSLE